MLKLLSAALVALVLSLGPGVPADAVAQERAFELSQSLSRLQNNPRYRGRILGTHLRRHETGLLYEVRILRQRDDRVILVYIDPRTGGVVADSERGGAPPRRTFRDRDRRPVPAPDRRRRR